jgi:hypothetical protein
MTISKSQVYKTTDGASYDSFKAAKAAQDVIDRTDRIQDLNILDSDSVEIVAKNGVAVLAALTLPSGRKPRAPKA